MSAPPPPVPGTRAYNGTAAMAPGRLDADQMTALFAAAVRAHRSKPARRSEQLRAYSRPDDPRGLFLTAAQWRDFDEWQLLCDGMERKYGHLKAFAVMNRGIW